MANCQLLDAELWKLSDAVRSLTSRVEELEQSYRYKNKKGKKGKKGKKDKNGKKGKQSRKRTRGTEGDDPQLPRPQRTRRVCYLCNSGGSLVLRQYKGTRFTICGTCVCTRCSSDHHDTRGHFTPLCAYDPQLHRE